MYVHLGNTENIESATGVLTEVCTLCKNENITGPIIFGAWNSRHPLWGNNLEKNMVNYTPTTVPTIVFL